MLTSDRLHAMKARDIGEILLKVLVLKLNSKSTITHLHLYIYICKTARSAGWEAF